MRWLSRRRRVGLGLTPIGKVSNMMDFIQNNGLHTKIMGKLVLRRYKPAGFRALISIFSGFGVHAGARMLLGIPAFEESAASPASTQTGAGELLGGTSS